MFFGSFKGIYVTELTDDGLSVKRDVDGMPVLKNNALLFGKGPKGESETATAV